MTKSRSNKSGIVVLRNSFLGEGDKLSDASLPLFPPVDLFETGDCYVLNAELPGVENSDIHVEVRGEEFCIWGERKVDHCCSEESYHRLEGIRGRFYRSFRLPEKMAEDAPVRAVLQDGVLRVEIAKSTKSRRIAIEHDPARD